VEVPGPYPQTKLPSAKKDERRVKRIVAGEIMADAEYTKQTARNSATPASLSISQQKNGQ
jgi:hypothetical protein